MFISSREREGTVKSASVKRVTATNRQVRGFREGERGYCSAVNLKSETPLSVVYKTVSFGVWCVCVHSFAGWRHTLCPPVARAHMSRYGDSRVPMAPQWKFGSETRPRVGTSRTYQGREVEMNQVSKIGGLSPGPAYKYGPGKRNEVDGASNYTAPPEYSFGRTRVELDKRVSPGPCNYGFAQAPTLGPQKINSIVESRPRWSFGSSTRENREMVHVAKGRLFSNNLPSRSLVGGFISSEMATTSGIPGASGAMTTLGGATKLAPTPSRDKLGRALAVAMTAEQASSDPILADALATLHNRVATLASQSHSQRLEVAN